MALTATALMVRTAAERLGCQEALDWLEIITNGDPSGHEQTPIHTLINELGQSVEEAGLTKRIKHAVVDAIRSLAGAHYKGMAKDLTSIFS